MQAAEHAAGVVAEAASLAPARRCKSYQLDVRNSQRVEEVGDAVLADFDVVDVVVCNAGINRNKLAVTMSDSDWRDVIDTNLSGAFYVARHVLPTFLAQGRGRLIFLSSIARDGFSGQANYAASKAGLPASPAPLPRNMVARASPAT